MSVKRSPLRIAPAFFIGFLRLVTIHHVVLLPTVMLPARFAGVDVERPKATIQIAEKYQVSTCDNATRDPATTPLTAPTLYDPTLARFTARHL